MRVGPTKHTILEPVLVQENYLNRRRRLHSLAPRDRGEETAIGSAGAAPDDWIFHHASDSASGGCDMHLRPRIQRFTRDADGAPSFGIPLPTSRELPVPWAEGGSR